MLGQSVGQNLDEPKISNFLSCVEKIFGQKVIHATFFVIRLTGSHILKV